MSGQVAIEGFEGGWVETTNVLLYEGDPYDVDTAETLELTVRWYEKGNPDQNERLYAFVVSTSQDPT